MRYVPQKFHEKIKLKTTLTSTFYTDQYKNNTNAQSVANHFKTSKIINVIGLRNTLQFQSNQKSPEFSIAQANVGEIAKIFKKNSSSIEVSVYTLCLTNILNFLSYSLIKGTRFIYLRFWKFHRYYSVKVGYRSKLGIWETVYRHI